MENEPNLEKPQCLKSAVSSVGAFLILAIVQNLISVYIFNDAGKEELIIPTIGGLFLALVLWGYVLNGLRKVNKTALTVGRVFGVIAVIGLVINIFASFGGGSGFSFSNRSSGGLIVVQGAVAIIQLVVMIMFLINAFNSEMERHFSQK